MSTTTVKPVKINGQKQNQKKLSASIMHAVEIKSTFELYAYRCISPEQFSERIDELISLYKKTKG